MAKKKFNDMMDKLKSVPGTVEHLNSYSVLMGKKILRRRYELGLTQGEVVQLIQDNGEKITQATLSKAESGDGNIGSDTYDKIFNALGGLHDVEV